MVADQDRSAGVPPHDMDAEAAVISSVMLDQAALDDLANLQPEHFYSEAHRRIFEAALAVREAGRHPDVVAIGNWLKKHDRIAQVGGMPYLTQLLNASPATPRVGVYGELVRELWRVREFINVTRLAMARAYSEPKLELIEKHAHEVARLADDQANDALVPIATAMSEAFNESQLANATGLTGTRTGLADLDAITTGMHDGENIVVAGRPGMGKSALVFGIAVHVAEHEDGGVCVLSLEMPRKQVAQRLAVARAGLDLRRLRARKWTDDELSRWTAACSDIGRLPILIDDTAAMTVRHMRAKCRRAAREFTLVKKRLKLVVVDYLQLATHPTSQSREQEVSEISRAMKSIAKEFSCTVVALSQLNRGVESRSDKRPGLSDLRESGSIEQDADAVVLLYRDDYYNKKSARKGVAELIVAKQRNGPPGTVYAKWEARSTAFRTLSPAERIAAGLMSEDDDVMPQATLPQHGAPRRMPRTPTTPAAAAAPSDDDAPLPEPPPGLWDDEDDGSIGALVGGSS